jgi:hypothetical protein
MPARGPVPIEPDDAVFGVPNAPVTAVIFLDHMNPGSWRTMRAVERVRQKMPTDFRYVIKLLPSCRYRHARATARAAAAVLELGGANAFWSFQEAVLEYWSRVSPAFLASAARDAGLSEEQVAQLQDARFDARIQRDQKLADALHVEASPTLFVNGVRLDTWVGEKALTETLSAELRPARAAKLETQNDALAYQRRVEENAKGWAKPEEKERPDPSVRVARKTCNPRLRACAASTVTSCVSFSSTWPGGGGRGGRTTSCSMRASSAVTRNSSRQSRRSGRWRWT